MVRRYLYRLRPIVLSCCLIFLALAAAPSHAQAPDPPSSPRTGKIHDKLRAAKQREAETLAQEVDDAITRYVKAKKQIEAATGLSYVMLASSMSQWGTPDGGYGAVQAQFSPSVNWAAFDSPLVGAGSFQFDYLATQYWSGASGTSLQGRLNLNTPINDYQANALTFSQVTYTHEFPGKWLSVSLGQFPFSNFDGNLYANNQQLTFIAYPLSQNGSQNYSSGSLGAYVEVNPTPQLTFASGFQDGNNILGAYMQFATLGQGQYAWFLYGAWTPVVGKLGQGLYSLLYYNQPGVAVQPLPGDGLSFSASQPLGDKWGVFLRANTAWNSSAAIQSSVAGGAVYNNPLGRNSLDQIGLAVAWNRTNLNLYSGAFARPSETMLEAYWATTVLKRIHVTPDVQLYLQPALTPAQQLAAVFTVRVTVLF